MKKKQFLFYLKRLLCVIPFIIGIYTDNTLAKDAVSLQSEGSVVLPVAVKEPDDPFNLMWILSYKDSQPLPKMYEQILEKLKNAAVNSEASAKNITIEYKKKHGDGPSDLEIVKVVGLRLFKEGIAGFAGTDDLIWDIACERTVVLDKRKPQISEIFTERLWINSTNAKVKMILPYLDKLHRF